MNPRAKIKGKQIGLVHVAKAQLIEKGVLTEESYRDCLATYGQGAKSSTELNGAQLDALMQHFQATGFVYRPKNGQKVHRPKACATGLQRIKQAHLAAIGKLLESLGKDWSYAEGIARQMGSIDKRVVLVWKFLSPELLHQVGIALRYKVREEAGDPVARRPETLAKRRGQGSGVSKG